MSAVGAVKFALSSPAWPSNLLSGALLMLIPIVGPIAFAGWMAEAHQRLVRRHPEPLPKFDFGDFMHYVTRGVPVFLVGVLAGLPILIVVIVSGAVVGVATALASGTGESLMFIAVVTVTALFTIGCAIALTVVKSSATTCAELSENLGESLKPGKLWAYSRATWSQLLIKLIVVGLLAFGLTIAGMLLCFIGIYPAVAAIQIASMHLRWQIYDRYLQAGGEPLPIREPQWLPSDVARYHRGQL